MSISRSVERIIRKKPFIQEALARGIINVAALAEELKPEIEKDLGKDVKFSAVNMALRRSTAKLNKKLIHKISIRKEIDILIRSDLVEITLYKSREVQKCMKDLYNLFNERDNFFLTITQGLNEIMIICNKRYESSVLNYFKNSEVKKKITGLSAVTLNIPKIGISTQGLFYIVTRALHWDNINIIDIVSTYTEMSFIIKEDNTSRAFESLKRVIEDF